MGRHEQVEARKTFLSMNKQKSEKSNNNAQTLWSRVKLREGASNEETTASLCEFHLVRRQQPS